MEGLLRIPLQLRITRWEISRLQTWECLLDNFGQEGSHNVSIFHLSLELTDLALQIEEEECRRHVFVSVYDSGAELTIYYQHTEESPYSICIEVLVQRGLWVSRWMGIVEASPRGQG
jgi:hypothetical protein